MAMLLSEAPFLSEALLGVKAVTALATPANLRLGREIAAAGVELVELSPSRAVAKVTGGQRRTVELVSECGELRWSCSCSKKADLFCKHCVAAALATREKAPQAAHSKSGSGPRAAGNDGAVRPN